MINGSNEKPLVSIIMGVYNEEFRLNDCINSIISQSYDNWEFVICDDCSTDNSYKILKEYSEQDRRIVVVKNETNLRLSASLNKCLDVARGKYIARMDADDISLPNRLAVQVAYLEENPSVSLVGCNSIIFDDNGEYGVRKTIEFPSKEVLLKGSPFAHPTIMMRRKVYLELGGYTVNKKTMRAEDLDLWFRFFKKGYVGVNIQEALYKYREGPDDIKKRTIKAAIETAKVYWDGYKDMKFPYYKRFWVIKPIIAAIIPDVVMLKIYRRKII